MALSVYDYYKSEKSLIYKLIFIILLTGVFEVFGIFAIVPYIQAVFGGSAVNKEYFDLLYEAIPCFKSQECLLLSLVLFYIIRAASLVYLIDLRNNIVALAHSKLLQELYSYNIFPEVVNINSSDLIRIYTRDSLVFVYAFLLQASILVTEVIIFLSLFVGLIYYQIETLFLFPVLIIMIYGAYKYIKNRVSILSRDDQSYNSKMIRGLQEFLQSNSEIKVYHVFDKSQLHMNNIFNKKTKTYSKIDTLMQVPRIILETIFVLLVITIIYYISLFDRNIIEPSIMVFVLMAGMRFLPMSNKIVLAFGWFKNGKVSLDALNEVFNKHQKKNFFNERIKASGYKDNLAISIRKIESYHSGREIYKNISFNVFYGKTVSIIGKSGSGKSTLLRQIAGLLERPENSVEFFSHIKNKLLEPKIAFVPQSPTIFHGSLYENLKFMRDVESDFKKNMDNVIKIVGLSHKINLSKDGFNQILDEDGKNFSGGEKYRVTIARALLFSPDILIIDEPTAALDGVMSVKLIENIRSSFPNLAIVTSTHDSRVIELSDLVINL